MVLMVEMMGLEPAAFCLQSSRELAACYPAKTLLSDEHESNS
jgi:hypothetical protein